MKTSLHTTFGGFVLLFSLIAAQAHAAQLQKIEHKSLGPGSEEVRLSFDEGVEPKIFTMDGGKPRIVLDFPGATRAAAARDLSPKSALVRAVRVGVDKNRTRVVCDVSSLKGLNSNARLEGGLVIITMSGAGAAAPAAPEQATAETPAAASTETPAAPEKPATPARLAPARKVKGPGADKAVLVDDPAELATEPAVTAAPVAPIAPVPPETPATPAAHAVAETPVPEPPPGPSVPGAPRDAVDTPYLSAIQFDPDSPRGELVQFKLNGFYPPVLRSIESGSPQVICEFNNLEVAPALEGPIKLSGRLVKGIRLDKSPTDGKVRVFVQLEPNKHYDLQQVFFKEDNFFVLMVNTAKQ